MRRPSNNSIYKSLSYVAVGAITAASAVGAGVAIYFILIKNHDTEVPSQNLGPLKEYDFTEYKTDTNGDFVLDPKGNKIVVRSIPNLKINQYMTPLPDGTQDYYLDEKGINHLISRFFETGNYGPEIFSLQKIWITKVELTSSAENGTYIPNTHEIGLNGTNDAQRLYNAVGDWKIIDGIQPWTEYNNVFRDLYRKGFTDNESLYESQKYRAELMLGTLLHEYGHHLANSYFSSPYFGNQTVASKNVIKTFDNYAPKDMEGKSEEEKEAHRNRWNKNFLDGFETAFRYNSYLANGNKFSSPMIFGDLLQKQYESVGSRYSSDQLFYLSNHDENHAYSALDKSAISGSEGAFVKYLGFAADKKFLGVGQPATSPEVAKAGMKYNYQFIPIETNKSLQYFYSSEEQFTRKVLLSSWAVEKTTFDAFARNKITTDLFEDEEKYETLYLAKGIIQNGKTNIVPNVAYDTAPERSVQYMNDNPYTIDFTDPNNPKTGAQELMELINNHIGHADGDNISYVWNENRWTIVDSGKITDNQTSGSDIKLFRFGGYTDSKDYKNVVFSKDGKTANYRYPIVIEDFNLGYKNNIYSGSRNPLNGKNPYFYATTVPIEKSAISGIPVYFEDDKGNLTPMTSFRGMNTSEYGVASTYEEQLPAQLRIASNNGFFYTQPQSLLTNSGKFVAFINKNVPGSWGGL